MPPLMTVSEIANRLRITAKTVHSLVRDGKLSCVAVTARKRLFTEDQLQEFIQARTIAKPKMVIDKAGRKKLRSGLGGTTGKQAEVIAKADLREEMRSWR